MSVRLSKYLEIISRMHVMGGGTADVSEMPEALTDKVELSAYGGGETIMGQGETGVFKSDAGTWRR